MQVRRDPFARGAYHRYSVYQDHRIPAQRLACSWCGQTPARLYMYVWQSDDRVVPREPDTSKVFCNFQCHFSYHD